MDDGPIDDGSVDQDSSSDELSVDSELKSDEASSHNIPQHLRLPVPRDREKQLCGFLMPYELEPLSEIDDHLEHLIQRLVKSVLENDYEGDFVYWYSKFHDWLALRCPIERRLLSRLIAFFYNLSVSPGMDPVIAMKAINMTISLIKSDRALDVRWLRLDWELLFRVLETELHQKQRVSNFTNIYTSLFELAQFSSRFFPPHMASAMWDRFLPRMDASNPTTAFVAQSLLCHFLPITHPNLWLESVFQLAMTFHSHRWSEQWLDLLSRLSQKHINPNASDPRLEHLIRNLGPDDDFESKSLQTVLEFGGAEPWKGLRKDVGIYTEKQWLFIMTQCIQSFGVRFGDRAVHVTGSMKYADAKVTSVIAAMMKPSDALESFATIIIYSMSEDGDAENPHSRALEAISKLLTATETFFHPSNHGSWSPRLARFLRHLLWRFAVRWEEEAKPDCPTPGEWRLTGRIRTQLVNMLISPILMCMFSKDSTTFSWTKSSLKIMAYLEPSLILPPILERSVLALEGLLEPHRTTSCISALESVMGTLLKPHVYPSGASTLPTILELLLPGIDPNDASKTMNSAMLISQAVSQIKISESSLDNIGFPEAAEKAKNDEKPIESEPIILESGTTLADWTLQYFRRMMVFFENLPEPQGKLEKTGGKLEEHTISYLCLSFEELCKAISPELIPSMIEYFKDYVSQHSCLNMVKTVGQLAGSLSRGFEDPTVFRTFFPLCNSKIRAELEAGASSQRTMSAGSPIVSDLKLHWFLSILIGVFSRADRVILEFKEEVLDLLGVLTRDCKSKRSYIYIAELLQKLLGSLLDIYPKESRFLNPDEWHDLDKKKTHQHLWGKMYKVNEVKIQWHVPEPEEIDFVMRMIEMIALPMMEQIKELLAKSTLDHDMKCDFIKLCTSLRAIVDGTAALIPTIPPTKPGDPITDLEISEYSSQIILPSLKAGIPLSPDDSRLSQVVKFRTDLAELMHLAAAQLSLFNDNIECVKAILRFIAALLLDPSSESGFLGHHQKAYKYVKSLNDLSRLRKQYPRIVWLRYAQVLHHTRLALSRAQLQRSATDDMLIKDLFEFSVSSWVMVRQMTQKTLCSVVRIYDGSVGLVLPALFECLKPGTDSDRMKGALYVLSSKTFSRICLRDWRYTRQFWLGLLQCQHSEKSSIQNLVARSLRQFSRPIREFEALKSTLRAEGFQEAVRRLNSELLQHPLDTATIDDSRAQHEKRILRRENESRQLVSELLKLAQASTTHWKYSLFADRLLMAFLRRDRPLNEQVASHFINNVLQCSLAPKRSQALSGISRILHFIKLRTTSESEEALLLLKSKSHLRISIEFPPLNLQEEFLGSLQVPLNESPPFLIDKFVTGWLVCGKEKAYTVPTEKDMLDWDSSSSQTLNVMREAMKQENFWQTLASYYSQEHARKSLLMENVMILKAVFQIFRDEFWPVLLPSLENLITDTSNKHKQRAAAEIVAGAIRGTKHWPIEKQHIVWDWFQDRFSSIYDAITPDVITSWLMCVGYILRNRDPRRNKPLIDFIFGLETEGCLSAFATSKAHQFIGATLKALSWPFIQPYLKKYSDLYWSSINHDYLEVRGCISLNLRTLTEHQTHLSYPDTATFLQLCQDVATQETTLIAQAPLIDGAIRNALLNLHRTREIRLPAQHGSQEYDKSSMSILTWIWISINDFQPNVIYSFIPDIIPELFYMQEMIDNQDLTGLSSVVVEGLVRMLWPTEKRDLILSTLLKLLKAPSWKVRLDVLRPLRTFFFYQIYTLSRPQVEEVLECLCELLEDSNAEVREAAAKTLSGIVHCSERTSILKLKAQFTTVLKQTPVPKRFENGVESPNYATTIIKIHAAVLGCAALVNAFPYDVPAWMPEVLIASLCRQLSSPAVISTTARTTLTTFKNTHQDTWAEGRKMFSPEDLATLDDCLIGSSYYA